MSGTWHRPRHCRQVNIENQGTLEASITLSPEAFGIASLNDGASKGGEKAWQIALFLSMQADTWACV
ncbi:Enolase [Gossypium arboreum]|uniref:Enolase n=1 Tax=Gossypium arboreum TaxID=29729 RepID=A0A0B0PLL5_GOSAR|nr:Enolase [Gossypium arboreum]